MDFIDSYLLLKVPQNKLVFPNEYVFRVTNKIFTEKWFTISNQFRNTNSWITSSKYIIPKLTPLLSFNGKNSRGQKTSKPLLTHLRSEKMYLFILA